MANLYIIRHSETQCDKQGLIYGEFDSKLTELGIDESRILGQVFTSYSMEAVYSSRSSHCLEAAQIIAESLGLEVQIEDSFDERKMGAAQGMQSAEFEAIYMEEITARGQLSFYERLFHKIVPEGESDIDLAERVLPVIHNICSEHLDGDVVIVTHSNVIKLLMILIGKFEEDSIGIEKGAVLEVRGDGKQLTIISNQGISGQRASVAEEF